MSFGLTQSLRSVLTPLGAFFFGSSVAVAQIPRIHLGNVLEPTPDRPASKRRGLLPYLQREVVDKVEIAGERRFIYQNNRVEGDREAFDTTNYFGQGSRRIIDTGQLSIAGNRVLGVLDFRATITDSRVQDPDLQRWTLTYGAGSWRAAYGDISGTLTNTNRFTRFGRSLNGGQVEYRSGPWRAVALRSETRGAATTVSIEGNNTAGPYYLQSGRVRAETVAVQVDGEDVRLGVDYIVDTELGTITFIDRLIPPTSVIVATYESTSVNEAAGLIQGVGVTVDFGSEGRLGFSGLTQTGQGSGSDRTRVELFQGFGNPGTPYWLDFEPVTGTAVIRIGSAIQLDGVDYRFDTVNPRQFFMNKFVDPAQTITVTYRPRTLQTIDGDRRSYGVDYRLPFGRRGSGGFIQADLARGETSEGEGAFARGLNGEYRQSGWVARGGFRDIPVGFVTVESRGFSRNEQVSEVSLEKTEDRRVHGSRYSNSRIVSSTSSSSGPQITRVSRASAFTRYNNPDGPRWTLEHAHQESESTSRSRLDTTTYTAARQFGPLQSSLSLENQFGYGRIRKENVSEDGNITLQSASVRLSGAISDELEASMRSGVSRVQALGESGLGYDVSGGITWRPSQTWSVVAAASYSDGGQLATLGFSTGIGAGYDGNGFSGGSGGDAFNTGRNELASFSLIATRQDSARLNWTASYSQVRTLGNLSANTDSQTYSAGANWDLGSGYAVSASLDRSTTRYIGSAVGAGSADSVSFGIGATPPGRFSWSGSVTGLLSRGGSITQSQDNLYWDASAFYRLDGRQRVSFSYVDGSTTGFSGQTEQFASFAYDYRIFSNVSLRAVYRVRQVRNNDPSISAGSYRSQGLDIELGFDFFP